MSNGLSVVDSQFRAISEGSSFAGSDIDFRSLTSVSIPAQGVTFWSWNVLGVDFSEKSLSGVVVVNGPLEYVLWPHANKSGGEKSLPAMRSPDGRVAYRIGDDLGDLDPQVIEAAKNGKDADGRDTYDVARIPYFNWQKDAKGRNSRRAKATKVIAVLRPGDISPLVVRLSNTSSPVAERFFADVRGKLGLDHWQFVTDISLEKVQSANPYARIVAKFVGPISSEDAACLKAAYTDPLSIHAKGRNDRVVRDAVSLDAVPF